jgi:preprotein translocase subunit SecY
MYGAQSTYIPIKVNPSGVIPVIFASALLSFPLQIATTLGQEVRWLATFANWLNPQGAPYLIIYALLIVGFAFFYTQVSMNPVEMAKQIRENGGSVPGVRSEKLEEYLTKVLNRIVLPGSLFLAFIALIPTLVQMFFNFPSSVAMLFGGTSLLILVGVDLDTMRQIEGVMKMHHYDGFNVDGKKRKSKHI